MPEMNPADRLYRNARREAIIVIVVWAMSLIWVVGYCYLYGYEHGPDSWVVQTGLVPSNAGVPFEHIGGMPEWVVYGIIVPWVACTLFTALFSMVGMADDDLGREGGEEAGHGH